MATKIKFTVDGIKDEMIVPSIGFSVSSDVTVSNQTQEMNFNPVRLSDFPFQIEAPNADTSKKLLEWIVNHEIKKKAELSINSEALTKNARIISFKDVCLISFTEDMGESYSTVSLTLKARTVVIDGVEFDQSKVR